MSVKIFFCYAHEDEPLLNKLKAHLRPLQGQGLIATWYDRDIGPGSEWEREIKEQLDSAQIILLLISPDFMASDYVNDVELIRAIEKHDRGEARVIPIILRSVYWQVEPLVSLQALPTDGKPISGRSWHNLDEAFLDVVKGIRKAIEDLSKNNEAVAHITKLREFSPPTDDPERISRFRNQPVGDKVIDGVKKELEQLPWANQSQRLSPKSRKKLFLALRKLFIRKTFREKVEECLDQNWGSRLRIACLTKEVLRDYQTYISRFEASEYRFYEQLLVEVDEYCLALMAFFRLNEPYHTLDDFETHMHSAEEFKKHLPNRRMKAEIPPENIARSDRHLERIHELVEKLTAVSLCLLCSTAFGN